MAVTIEKASVVEGIESSRAQSTWSTHAPPWAAGSASGRLPNAQHQVRRAAPSAACCCWAATRSTHSYAHIADVLRASLNEFIRARDHRRRDRQPESLGRLEVDDQL